MPEESSEKTEEKSVNGQTSNSTTSSPDITLSRKEPYLIVGYGSATGITMVCHTMKPDVTTVHLLRFDAVNDFEKRPSVVV